MTLEIALLALGVFLLIGGWQAWKYRGWPSGLLAGIVGTAIISLVMLSGR